MKRHSLLLSILLGLGLSGSAYASEHRYQQDNGLDKGTGVAQGSGVVRGKGIASGTGTVIYRGKDCMFRW